MIHANEIWDILKNEYANRRLGTLGRNIFDRG